MSNATNHTLQRIIQDLLTYIRTSPLPFDDGNADSVLELLYNAYANAQGADPDEIKAKFATVEDCLTGISFEMNNLIFATVCDLCLAFEKKGFMDGIRLGSHLMLELQD
ncbi:MAG: hypothetical protein E7454_01625 [Ruminococcaceae bacterium]|nr:hypothetical protein [Oscillospiraceae bacterium]